jgi:hypothetical protein
VGLSSGAGAGGANLGRISHTQFICWGILSPNSQGFFFLDKKKIMKKNIDVELLNLFVNTLFLDKVYFTRLEQLFIVVKVVRVIALKINKN